MEAALQQFLEAGLAPSTQKVYSAGWNRYLKLTHIFSLACLPVTGKKATLFVISMTASCYGQLAALHFWFVRCRKFLVPDSSTFDPNSQLLLDDVSLDTSASGVDGSLFNGYSFRLGAATSASIAKVSETIIKHLGRWQSYTYQWYIRTPPSDLAHISQQLYHQTAPLTLRIHCICTLFIIRICRTLNYIYVFPLSLCLDYIRYCMFTHCTLPRYRTQLCSAVTFIFNIQLYKPFLLS